MKWWYTTLDPEIASCLESVLFNQYCSDASIRDQIIRYIAWYLGDKLRDTALSSIEKLICEEVDYAYNNREDNYQELFLAIVAGQELLVCTKELHDFYYDSETCAVMSKSLWRFSYPLAGNIYRCLDGILPNDMPVHTMYGLSLLARSGWKLEALTDASEVTGRVDSLLYPESIPNDDSYCFEQLMASFYALRSFKEVGDDIVINYFFDKKRIPNDFDFYTEQEPWDDFTRKYTRRLSLCPEVTIDDRRLFKQGNEWTWMFGHDINASSRLHQAIFDATGIFDIEDLDGEMLSAIEHLKYTWFEGDKSVETEWLWALIAGVKMYDLPECNDDARLKFVLEDTERPGMCKMTVYSDGKKISHAGRDSLVYRFIVGQRLDEYGDRLGIWGTTFFNVLSAGCTKFHQYRYPNKEKFRQQILDLQKQYTSLNICDRLFVDMVCADCTNRNLERSMISFDGYFLMVSPSESLVDEGIYNNEDRYIDIGEQIKATKVYNAAEDMCRDVPVSKDVPDDPYNRMLFKLYSIIDDIVAYYQDLDSDMLTDFYTYMVPAMNYDQTPSQYYREVFGFARTVIKEHCGAPIEKTLDMSLYDLVALALYYLHEDKKIE